MEENARKNLPFILEVLIVGIILFLFSSLVGKVTSPYYLEIAAQNAQLLFLGLAFLRNGIGLFAGGWVCFKIIQRYNVKVWIIFLMSIGIWIVTQVFNSVFFMQVSRLLTIESHSVMTQVGSVIFPVIRATILTVFVRLLNKPRDDTSFFK